MISSCNPVSYDQFISHKPSSSLHVVQGYVGPWLHLQICFALLTSEWSQWHFTPVIILEWYHGQNIDRSWRYMCSRIISSCLSSFRYSFPYQLLMALNSLYRSFWFIIFSNHFCCYFPMQTILYSMVASCMAVDNLINLTVIYLLSFLKGQACIAEK